MGRAGTRSKTAKRGNSRASGRSSGRSATSGRRSTSGTRGAATLPIRNYDELTVGEIQSEIEDLKPAEVRKLQTYEEKHKGRQTLLRRFEQQRSRMGTRGTRTQGGTRSRGGGATPSRGRGSGGRASGGSGSSKRTTDHRTIRRWAEARGGVPVSVRGTGRGEQAGVLRFDFEGYGAGPDELREISWDEFFRKFDQKNLEFLYQDKTRNGNESRFFKFVQGRR